MKPYAYSVKCKEGEYLVYENQLGVKKHLKDCVITPIFTVPERYAVCPDRRHPEAILGDMGMDDDGKMVQHYSYQTDRRCRKERRKEE